MSQFGTPGGLASGNGVGVKNVQFAQVVQIVPRKVMIIGTYDPVLISVVDDVPVRIFNANEAAVKFGDGFMIHRLAIRAFEGSRGVETWIMPQSEAGGSSASAGDIDFAGSSGVIARQLFFYVAGIPVAGINLISGEVPDDIALKVAAAVTADKSLPVDAVINGGTSSQVDFTSKSTGPWGNDITLAFNLRAGEALPAGVVAAVTDMATGAGIPDVQDALDGMGTGDNQNDEFFTDMVCGYGQDTTTLDKISTYNGTGNDFTGNYQKIIARPFRNLVGDTAPGTGGLTTLTALADGRAELDRTNGILAAPGSFHHPMEIAVMAIGIMAATNNIRAEENYLNKVLPGLIPAPPADRWTNDYTNRDDAVKSGISTTLVKNNTVTPQDIITFYRPAAVVPESNGYRSQRNISIIQNILFNTKANFERERWQNITIVKDTSKVSSVLSQQKVMDRDDIIDDLMGLARLFEANAWIYSADFTIQRLQEDQALVTLLNSGKGWTMTLPVILSGEGGIFNTTIAFDVSLAIVL